MTAHGRTLAVAPDGIDRAALAWADAATPRRGVWGCRPLVLVFGLLGLQSALFLVFAFEGVGIGAYVSLHLALCAATATAGRWWVAGADDAAADRGAMVLQLAGWSALAGPFGTIVAAALFVPQRPRSSDAAPASDADTGLSRLDRLHGCLLDGRLRLAHAHAIRPLLDVIIDGTQTEKFDALGLISKRYDPALAPALRRALADQDGSVRVLAATVMAHRHNACIERIGVLQSAARAAPETARHWHDLAQARLDYATSGLLEASRAETEASLAQAHLARAAALDPNGAAMVVGLAAHDMNRAAAHAR